jgi:hypothetical protein
MSDIQTFGDRIKSILGFTKPPYSKIDNVLIYMSFLPKSHRYFTKAQKRAIVEQYGFSDLEKMEFIGDAVLEFVVVMIVSSLHNVKTPGDLHNLKVLLTKNITLHCFMEQYNLCSELGSDSVKMKQCADAFESIIGAMFIDFFYNQKLGFQSLYFISNWIKHNPTFNRFIYEAVTNKTISTCAQPIEEGPNPTPEGQGVGAAPTRSLRHRRKKKKIHRKKGSPKQVWVAKK